MRPIWRSVIGHDRPDRLAETAHERLGLAQPRRDRTRRDGPDGKRIDKPWQAKIGREWTGYEPIGRETTAPMGREGIDGERREWNRIEVPRRGKTRQDSTAETRTEQMRNEARERTRADKTARMRRTRPDLAARDRTRMDRICAERIRRDLVGRDLTVEMGPDLPWLDESRGAEL